MIYAKSSATFSATLTGAPTGLTGTMGVRVETTAGATKVARTTAGIAEVPAGSGAYSVTLTAPEDEGSYLVIWDSGEITPESVGVEELQVTRVQPFDSVVAFLPDPADVAAILRARTFSDQSEEVGEFNADTRPTEGQVQTLINQAGNEVGARLGQEIEDDTRRAYARELVALRAAMGVELSYFPELVNADNSAYEALRQLYESGLAALIEGLPDTSATSKGLYSLRMRSDVAGAGLLSTAELLP